MSSPQCAQTVLESLLAQGVRQIVLCPGSRSAPLAVAAEQAARQRRVELLVRIDERTAGFLALGLAKESGQVVPVLTTSGTAVGNLMPAVMEASHSGVPLLVLSADRPTPMIHTGANQTTDQVGLFGDFVRAAGRISSAEGGPSGWHFQVTRVVAAATGVFSRDPGPAHLNVAFAEPLVAPDPEPVPPLAPTLHGPAPAESYYRLDNDRRTVVLAGDATPEVGARAAAVAGAARLPLLAEPTSNARSGAALRAYRVLLRSGLEAEIERVVVFGHPTLSRPVTALLSRPDVQVVVVTTGARWSDPGANADLVVPEVDCRPGDPEWLERWQRADAEVSRGLDELLDDSAAAGATGNGLTGPAVAAEVLRGMRPGEILVSGSSNPIRDLDLAPVPGRGFAAYANRGLAGIDGTISTAAGIGLAAGRPVTALLGDLTLLHDAGGMLIGPLERRPDLRLVVVNDDGGAIFHLLEQGAEAYAASFERVFGTPHGVRLEPLAAAYGLAYANPGSRAELRDVLSGPVTGMQLVEVRLERTGRRALDQQIQSLATTALRQPGSSETGPSESDPRETDPGKTDAGTTGPSGTDAGTTGPSATDPGETPAAVADPE